MRKIAVFVFLLLGACLHDAFSQQELGIAWNPAELMHACVGVAYLGPEPSYLLNPAALHDDKSRKVTLLTDIAAYSNSVAIRLLPKIVQKRKLLDNYFLDRAKMWPETEETFEGMPREWGSGGLRIGLLSYAEKGFGADVQFYEQQSVRLEIGGGSLHFWQGSASRLVATFATGKRVVEFGNWVVRVGLGGRLWGYLILDPKEIQSSVTLRGRMTKPSLKFLWQEGRHGYGFRGDVGLLIHRRARSFSVGARMKNLFSSRSGIPESRSLDLGFSWRPLLRTGSPLLRSLIFMSDFLDLGAGDSVRPGIGLAIGSTWRHAQFWLGTNRGCSSAGLGLFWRHLDFGYAVLSGWDGELPMEYTTHTVYLRLSL